MLLGPRTVGSTSGFMGVATVAPGDRIAEHYHPYSEEFLYVARGAITVDLDDVPVPLAAGEALYVPVTSGTGFATPATRAAEVVFHLGPARCPARNSAMSTPNWSNSGARRDRPPRGGDRDRGGRPGGVTRDRFWKTLTEGRR